MRHPIRLLRSGRFLAVAALCLAFAAGASAQDAAPAPADSAGAPAPELVDRILVIVDEEAILQSDLEREVSIYFLEARNAGQEIEQSRSEVRDEVLQRLIESKLIIAAARQAEINIEDEAIAQGVEENISQLVRYYGSLQRLETELGRNGMTLSDYRARSTAQLRDQQYMRAVVNRFIRPRIEVREDEVQTYYAANRDRIPVVPDSLVLADILVPVQPDDAVQREVQRMLGAALQDLGDGMEFADAARKHSQGPNAARGGLVGRVREGDLFSPGLERAVFELGLGETSQPVVSERGIHILHVDEVGESGRVFSQIFFPIDVTAEDIERARAAADDAHRRILQGEPFARVALEVSVDPNSADRGGDLGTFALDALTPEIREQLAELGAGDMTEPFLTPGGFYIFLVKERLEGGQFGYEDIKEQLRRAVESEKLEAELTAYVAGLREQFVVDVKN